MKRILACLVVVGLLLGGCTSTKAPTAKILSAGGEFSGKVTEVHDGDTLVVVSTDGKHKVRLACIDAPELAQPFGPESKAALEGRVGGKNVRVTWTNVDRYDRIVGNVYYGNNKWANIEMIACGMAWQYKAYSTDENMAKLEILVRNRKLGLWKQDAPVAPWEYRKQKKQKE